MTILKLNLPQVIAFDGFSEKGIMNLLGVIPR